MILAMKFMLTKENEGDFVFDKYINKLKHRIVIQIKQMSASYWEANIDFYNYGNTKIKSSVFCSKPIDVMEGIESSLRFYFERTKGCEMLFSLVFKV